MLEPTRHFSGDGDSVDRQFRRAVAAMNELGIVESASPRAPGLLPDYP